MITITIPTTGRPQRLYDCLKSIADEPDIEIKIGCRNIGVDIPLAVLRKCEPFNKLNISMSASDLSIIEIQNYLAMTASLKSDILPIADDVIFQPGAISAARKAMSEEFPDYNGIIGFNIINLPKGQASLYAFMLIGRKFFSEHLNRTIFYPEYKHFYADIELGEAAEKIGKFYFCEEARVIHYHPVAGYPQDETYRRNRQSKWAHDNKLYQSRAEKFNANLFL